MSSLHEQLSRTANNVELTPGSARRAAHRGRVRARRRKSAQAGVAAAVLLAAVGGVYRLTSVRQDGSLAVSGVEPARDPSVAASTTEPDAYPAGATGASEYSNDPLAGLPQTRMAQAGDDPFTWVAYPVDSPEALALRFDPDARYAIGTAPAPNGDGQAAALYTRIGDGWELAQSDIAIVPQAAVLEGDKVYTTGNEARVRMLDAATGVWSDLGYPSPTFDDNLRGLTEMIGATSSGPLLLTDYEVTIEGPRGSVPQGGRIRGLDGDTVIYSRDCVEGGPIDRAARGGVQPDVASAEKVGCLHTVPLAEVDLTQQEQAEAALAGHQLWRYEQGAWTRVQMPAGEWPLFVQDDYVVTQQLSMGTTYLTTLRYYRVGPDGSIAPLFGGQETVGEWSRLSGRPRPILVSGGYVLADDPSGAWHATNVHGLDLAADAAVSVDLQHGVQLTEGTTVVAGFTYLHEPEVFTNESYSLTREVLGAGQSRWLLTDLTTGEERADIIVHPGGGGDSTDFSVYPVLGDANVASDSTITDEPPTPSDQPITVFEDVPRESLIWKLEIPVLLASADGLHYGTVDIDELVATQRGIEADFEVTSLTAIDNRVIARVTDPASEQSYVLVGTPK